MNHGFRGVPQEVLAWVECLVDVPILDERRNRVRQVVFGRTTRSLDKVFVPGLDKAKRRDLPTGVWGRSEIRHTSASFASAVYARHCFWGEV